MSVNWHFEKISENSMDKKDPTQYTVQSHDTKLSNIQIFLREVAQNVGDSLITAKYKNAVLDFELTRLFDVDKSNFLSQIKFNELIPHLKSVRAEQKKRKASNILPDLDTFLNNSKALRLLYINDKNTHGLIGPEFGSENSDENEIKSFMGLCRGTGGNEKGENLSSGGTNGYGKSVLWKHSELSLVFFYSKLSNKYVDPTGKAHESRLIGICRMADHYINNEPQRGIVNFGSKVVDSQNVRALYDKEADELALKLGFNERSKSDSGTSILIIGFQDLAEEEREDRETLKDLKLASEEFYWPSLIDKSLTISFSVRNDNGTEIANPLTNSRVKPFIDIYEKQKVSDTGIVIKTVEVDVPKYEIAGFSTDSKNSELKLCAQIYEDSEPTNTELLNHIALLRGSKMVIKYEKAFNIGGKSFHGLVMAGTLINETEKQKHLERLIALSEPISHDDWNQNSDNLKDWRSAKARIKQIKELIKKEFNDITSSVKEPEGDAAPALSKMFSFDEGGGRELEPRKIKQSSIIISQKRNSDGQGVYVFGFDITVPSKVDFDMKNNPEKWKLQLKLGSVGEKSRTSIIIPFNIKLSEAWKDGSLFKSETNFSNIQEFEDGLSDKQIKYSFKGITEVLNKSELDFNKVELQIETYKI